MLLWSIFALMTAVAILSVLWPLSRAVEAQGGSDIAVYRDQLEEVDRDHKAGLIGEAEAQAARVEVSRRLITAADRTEHSVPIGSSLWRRYSPCGDRPGARCRLGAVPCERVATTARPTAGSQAASRASGHIDCRSGIAG